jgi:UDP-GlcNAc:undecaprenyl-phosphate GlcNAc-1-phosphate transferase
MVPLAGYLWRFAAAFLMAVVVTLAVRSAARALGLVAKPRPDRWHRKPTALYGGVGIFTAFLVTYLIHRPSGAVGGGLLTACASGMFLLGLVDDKIQLKAYTKLVAQIVFATLFTTFGLRLHWLHNAILDQGLTIFWLVGVTNALNLLDNIDGAAAGIAAIAGSYLIYFCHAAGQTDLAVMAACFTGAVLGFLVFNFNPASIFMGDCGSLFIGFFLGGLSVVNFQQAGARRNVLAVLAIPVLLLLLPILDTTLVTISRRFHGRAVSQGGRDHTSHRLVALGLSERQATLLLWAIAALSGGLAVLVKSASTFVAAAVVAVFLFALLFLMIFLGKVKVYEGVASESEARGRALLPTLADFSYKRRVFETLNDLALILLCYYGAFLLRFDGQAEPWFTTQFVNSMPVVIVSQISVFLAMGLYRGVWRYTGVDDLVVIVRAVGAAVILSTAAVLFVFRFEGFSRAVFIIDGALLLLGVGGSRISFRVLRAFLERRRPITGKRVLIYGAGDGGELLVRELMNNHDLGMVPVGFIDDDPQKKGRVIHGVPVVGSWEDCSGKLRSVRAEEIVLSTAKVEPARWQLVERLATREGVGCRRMRIAFD